MNTHPPLDDLLPRLPLPRPAAAAPVVSKGLSTPGTALFSGASSSTFSSSRLLRHAAFGFKFRSKRGQNSSFVEDKKTEDNKLKEEHKCREFVKI